MTPSQFRKNQQNTSNKDLQYTRISNSLLECFVQKKNIIAIKIVFFLAIKSQKIVLNNSSELTNLKLSLNDLSKVIKTDKKTVIRNIKKMQQTSISFVSINKDNMELIESMSIVPKFSYVVGNDIVEMQVFNKIIELIKDVENRFTVINSSNLMHLKNINTIKFIGLLKIIDSYSDNVAKKKTYTLDDLNMLFDVNYKNFYEFERKIIKPVKLELDEESQLTFIYDFNFESVGRGRPKAKEVVIYLQTNKNRQLKMF